MNIPNIAFECPYCGEITRPYYWNAVIFNGDDFKCEHCNKTIVIELYTAQDEEDMESE